MAGQPEERQGFPLVRISRSTFTPELSDITAGPINVIIPAKPALNAILPSTCKYSGLAVARDSRLYTPRTFVSGW